MRRLPAGSSKQWPPLLPAMPLQCHLATCVMILVGCCGISGISASVSSIPDANPGRLPIDRRQQRTHTKQASFTNQQLTRSWHSDSSNNTATSFRSQELHAAELLRGAAAQIVHQQDSGGRMSWDDEVDEAARARWLLASSDNTDEAIDEAKGATLRSTAKPPQDPAIAPRKAGCKKLMWFTALGTKSGTGRIAKSYQSFLVAALLSAARSAPSLEPHLIYDGPGDPEIVRWWRQMGGIVHVHRLSFYQKLEDDKQFHEEPEKWLVRSPAYLRLDIPLILSKYQPSPDVETSHVLYTDADVMFLKDIDSCSFPETATIRMGPQHKRGKIANSGVMYINVAALALNHNWMIKWGVNNHWPGVFDQTLLLQYFRKRRHGGLQLLDDKFNWKGYWGPNDDAVIVHFHGPKPNKCLECFLNHGQDEDYCAQQHYRICRFYKVFWFKFPPDGGEYYWHLLRLFYGYVGLATGHMQ